MAAAVAHRRKRRYTAAGRLIDRQIQNTKQSISTINYSYDASGNMTNATAPAKPGRSPTTRTTGTHRLGLHHSPRNHHQPLRRPGPTDRQDRGRHETGYVLDLGAAWSASSAT